VWIIIITIASRWLPNDSKENLHDAYDLENYVTTVVISKDSNLIDKKIEDTFLYTNPEISILKLTRNKQITNAPGRYIALKANDKLVLMCNIESLAKLNDAEDLSIHKTQDKEKKKQEVENEEEIENTKKQDDLGFVELLILPGS